MLKLSEGIKAFLARDPVVTTSWIFKLHCMLTSAMLLLFSCVLTFAELAGKDRIQCIVQNDKEKWGKFVETYCWASSTYTMADAYQRLTGTKGLPPGIANDFDDEDAKKYYAYYQWVVFVLFIQAMMCYVPKYLWDACEGGLVKHLSGGLGPVPDKERETKKKTLINYMRSHAKLHTVYAFRYFALEVLCWMNIVFQMYLMNLFLDREFTDYGSRVLTLSNQPQEDRVDPLVYVFPRVTKCTWHKYGPSGSIQKLDAMCVLPLNVINEKTYIVVWFWYMALTALLSGLVLYRMLLMFKPTLRSHAFHWRHRHVPLHEVKAVFKERDIGDWWLMYTLGNNMDPILFREIVCELAKQSGNLGC